MVEEDIDIFFTYVLKCNLRGWGCFEEFMPSLVLPKYKLDTKCLGLFPSPVVIKCG